jgi:UDP-glucose 4-epimerase
VVYGEPATRPTPESAPKLPESPYGVTKLAGEQYLYYYARVHGLEYVALRYSNVYGPRQDPHGEAGVVAIFGRRILEGTPLTVFGDGEQTRDYVFVGDVVAANLLASRTPLTPPGTDLNARAYNVGTGVETSVHALAREMMAAAGAEVPVESAPARPGELRHSSLDVTKLTAAGWTPQTSLRDGLKRTMDHIERETSGT